MVWVPFGWVCETIHYLAYVATAGEGCIQTHTTPIGLQPTRSRKVSSDIRSFQQQLGAARRVIAILGAGISASSGLPTFRGPGGLWKQHRAADLATPEAFEVDPVLVWQFYSARRTAALAAKPNRGHRALAELARRWGPSKFMVLTQNVDGLSERAGHPRDALVHLHGDLFTVKCTSFQCNYTEVTYADPLTPALGRDAEPSIDELPHCPRCQSLLRPGVVWFGEPLPFDAIKRADDFISSNEVDLILVVGMSATVWPAAGYIDEVALRGGRVAVFNVDAGVRRDDLKGSWYFEGDAAQWLPKALEPAVGRIK